MAHNTLKVFSFFVPAAVVFLIAVFLSFAFHAFSLFWWLDFVFHFLGGLAIVYLAVKFFGFFSRRELCHVRHIFLFVVIVVSFVSLVAVLWEFFEFFLKYFFHLPTQPDLADTLWDLFMGLLGGSFGAFLFRNV